MLARKGEADHNDNHHGYHAGASPACEPRSRPLTHFTSLKPQPSKDHYPAFRGGNCVPAAGRQPHGNGRRSWVCKQVCGLQSPVPSAHSPQGLERPPRAGRSGLWEESNRKATYMLTSHFKISVSPFSQYT